LVTYWRHGPRDPDAASGGSATGRPAGGLAVRAPAAAGARAPRALAFSGALSAAVSPAVSPARDAGHSAERAASADQVGPPGRSASAPHRHQGDAEGASRRLRPYS